MRRWAATLLAAGMSSVVPSAQAVDVPFFTPLDISNSANGALSVFAADVDSDGDLDVLSASRNDSKIAWYENDGSQTFTTHTIATSANGAQSVFAADVDNDGDLDILSASRNDDKIAWYENDGNQSFTTYARHDWAGMAALLASRINTICNPLGDSHFRSDCHLITLITPLS